MDRCHSSPAVAVLVYDTYTTVVYESHLLQARIPASKRDMRGLVYV